MISGDVIYCYSIDTHNLSRKETLQGPNASGDELSSFSGKQRFQSVPSCLLYLVIPRSILWKVV